jgi:SPP1 gp7 family putative phage head morphogenesis protein
MTITKAKQPPASLAYERELSELFLFMTDQIAKRFKNNVLLAMNVSTIEKFADAQTGNYARVMLTLSEQVKRKIFRQFSNDKIFYQVSKILMNADRSSSVRLYKALENKIGISTERLLARDGMTTEINALVLETTQWAKKLRDESLETFTNNTLHAMTDGQSLEDLLSKFNGLVEKRKNHAKFLASNQIQNFNSISANLRAKRLGIKKAIWVTADDDSVRPSHADRDGVEFDLAEGCYSSVDGLYLQQGVDFNCRCTVQYVLDEII